MILQNNWTDFLLFYLGACAVDAFVPNAAQYQVLQVGS